ncbi:MAG: hypothetical protein RL322_3076 [Pseudomonadota bacterium]|jgi:sulfur-oxidizing protein SoxY
MILAQSLCWPLAGAASCVQRTLIPAAFGAGSARANERDPATEPLAARSYDEAIRRFTGGPLPRPGKVTLDVAVLIDNGNTVPLSVRVEHPMDPDQHVRSIAVFSERNPQHEVLQVQLGPDSGRAEISTRIRLATSQKLMAVARLSDGSHWSHEIDVIVTLAACIEGEP